MSNAVGPGSGKECVDLGTQLLSDVVGRDRDGSGCAFHRQNCRSALLVAVQNNAQNDARTTRQRAHIGTSALVRLDTDRRFCAPVAG
jgi:hypothetical protein